MPIDLTAFTNPKFEFQILDADGKTPLNISMDFDQIGMELRDLMPGLYKSYDNPDAGKPLLNDDGSPAIGEDGKPKLQPNSVWGLVRLLYQERGAGRPESLPDLSHLLRAIGIAFLLPPHCGSALRIKLLFVYHEEEGRRAEKKTGTPVSPPSSTPIPASSASPTSLPASTPQSSTGCC